MAQPISTPAEMPAVLPPRRRTASAMTVAGASAVFFEMIASRISACF
jgi:hypothetical protein